ncbi:MAG: hypothetical protein ACYC09_12960 [Bacteroidota bacterium]
MKSIMQKIIKCVALLLCVVALTNAQTYDSSRYIADTSWSRIQLGTTTWISGYLVNDGTANADSVAVGFGLSADTSLAVRHKVYAGETFSISRRQAKNVWWKALGTAAVAIRLVITR